MAGPGAAYGKVKRYTAPKSGLSKVLDAVGAPGRAAQRVVFSPVREVLDAIDFSPETKFSVAEALGLSGTQGATAKEIFNEQPLASRLPGPIKGVATFAADVIVDPINLLGVGLWAKGATALRTGGLYARSLEKIGEIGGKAAAEGILANLGRQVEKRVLQRALISEAMPESPLASYAAALLEREGMASVAAKVPEAGKALKYQSNLVVKLPFSGRRVIAIPGTEKIGAALSTTGGRIFRGPWATILSKIPESRRIGIETPAIVEAAKADLAEPLVPRGYVRVYETADGWTTSKLTAMRDKSTALEEINFLDLPRTEVNGPDLVEGLKNRNRQDLINLSYTEPGAKPAIQTLQMPNEVRYAFLGVDLKRVRDGLRVGYGLELLDNAQEHLNAALGDATEDLTRKLNVDPVQAANDLLEETPLRRAVHQAIDAIAEDMKSNTNGHAVPDDIAETFAENAKKNLDAYAANLRENVAYRTDELKAGRGLAWKLVQSGNAAGDIVAKIAMEGRYREAAAIAKGNIPLLLSDYLDDLLDSTKLYSTAAGYSQTDLMQLLQDPDFIKQMGVLLEKEGKDATLTKGKLLNMIESLTAGSVPIDGTKPKAKVVGAGPLVDLVTRSDSQKVAQQVADALAKKTSTLTGAKTKLANIEDVRNMWESIVKTIDSGAPLTAEQQQFITDQLDAGLVNFTKKRLEKFRELGAEVGAVPIADPKKRAVDRIGSFEEWVQGEVAKVRMRAAESEDSWRIVRNEASQAMSDALDKADTIPAFIRDIIDAEDGLNATEKIGLISKAAKAELAKRELAHLIMDKTRAERLVSDSTSWWTGRLSEIWYEWERTGGNAAKGWTGEGNPFDEMIFQITRTTRTGKQAFRDGMVRLGYATFKNNKALESHWTKTLGLTNAEAFKVIQDTVDETLDLVVQGLEQASRDFETKGFSLRKPGRQGLSWVGVTDFITERNAQMKDAISAIKSGADPSLPTKNFEQVIADYLTIKSQVNAAQTQLDDAQRALLEIYSNQRFEFRPEDMKGLKTRYNDLVKAETKSIEELDKAEAQRALRKALRNAADNKRSVEFVLGEWQQKAMSAEETVKSLEAQAAEIRKALGEAMVDETKLHHGINRLASFQDRATAALRLNVSQQRVRLLTQLQQLGVTMDSAGDADIDFMKAVHVMEQLSADLFNRVEGILPRTLHTSVGEQGGLRVPERVAQIVTKSGPQGDLEEFSWVTKLWRASATTRIGFSNRNFIGAWINNKVQGIVRKDYEDALRFFLSLKENTVPAELLDDMSERELGLAADTIIKSTMRNVDWRTGMDIGTGEKLIGKAQTTVGKWSDYLDQHSIAKYLYNKSARNMDPQLMKMVGEVGVEQQIRMANYIGLRRMGLSHDMAIDQVFAHHFNYSDLSNFDRKIRKWVPFWTFRSRNLALQAQYIVHSPEGVRAMWTAREDLEDQKGDMVPPWLQGLYIPWGNGTINLNNFLPAADAMSLADSLSTLRSDPNAMAKITSQFVGGVAPTVAEIVLNKKFYNQAQVYSVTDPAPQRYGTAAESFLKSFGPVGEVMSLKDLLFSNQSVGQRIYDAVSKAGLGPQYKDWSETNYTPR